MHLRIAETLLERLPELEAEPFGPGSMAPDSGKPLAKWKPFTPPTEITHFRDPGRGFTGCADLDFYQKRGKPPPGWAISAT